MNSSSKIKINRVIWVKVQRDTWGQFGTVSGPIYSRTPNYRHRRTQVCIRDILSRSDAGVAREQTNDLRDQTRPVPPRACLVRMRGPVFKPFQGRRVPKRAAGGILGLHRRDLRSLSPRHAPLRGSTRQTRRPRSVAIRNVQLSTERGRIERERGGVVERGSLSIERGQEKETSSGVSRWKIYRLSRTNSEEHRPKGATDICRWAAAREALDLKRKGEKKKAPREGRMVARTDGAR